MSRMQLALNVDDLDEAVTFYSELFDAKPAKLKEGYANFALTEPAEAGAAGEPRQRSEDLEPGDELSKRSLTG
jgi:predicted enzyme related to lactoylglutathione lyase